VFDIGAFTSGLLTGLREGVEAALIVSIICAYLARTGNLGHLRRVGLGVAAAVVASAALGLVIFVTLGELRSPWEQVFEGTTMLLAAAVVTAMLFWMRRQASSVAGQLQRALERVLSTGSASSLALLAFTAVIREGLETALFLVGQATAATTSAGGAGGAGAASVLAGAAVGLAISVGLGYAFYRGSRRLNLGRFFRWTGVLLVFIAAGLLGSAVHEFVEIGWITLGAQTAFDISRTLSNDAGAGLFLRALFGYSSTPEVVALAAWGSYLVVILSLYLRPVPARPVARPKPAPIARA
jgi:high-affinity iron transporter